MNKNKVENYVFLFRKIIITMKYMFFLASWLKLSSIYKQTNKQNVMMKVHIHRHFLPTDIWELSSEFVLNSCLHYFFEYERERERERENHVLEEEEALKHPLTDLLLFQVCVSKTVNSRLLASTYIVLLRHWSSVWSTLQLPSESTRTYLLSPMGIVALNAWLIYII